MSKIRDKKVKADKLEKDYLSQFPPIYFIDKDLAPEKFEKDIKKAYKNYLLELQSKKKTTVEKIFFEFTKKMKKINADTVFGDNMSDFINWVNSNEFFEKVTENKELPILKNIKLSKFLYIAMKCRSLFIQEITKRININKYLPDYYASFGIYKNGFYVRFHQIQKEKTDGGTLYKHKRNLFVDGQEYELWFSKHAIDRVLQRVGDDYESPLIILGEFISHAPFMFNGFGSMQHLLCCYMLSPLRKDNQIFEFCPEVKVDVLKNHKDEERLMKYLYFPFVVKDNRIICKSALLPGFQGTPEYQFKEQMLKDPLKENEFDVLKIALKEFYSRSNENQNVISSDFVFIAIMFHKYGFPQFFDGSIDYYQPVITHTNQLKND